MRKYLFLLMLLAIAIIVKAGNRTELQMKEAAISVLNKNQTRAESRGELKEYLALSKLKIYGYDKGGFAVVTTDDSYNIVIGHSSSKYEKTIPCGFNWWLEAVNNNMTRNVAPAKARQRVISKTGLTPLIRTIWGQERPFNDNCVFTNNNKTYQCITGCVATALAQVMNYYRFPECGTGSKSYNITYNNDFTITFSEDFSQSYYDWDNMLDDYTSYYKNSVTDVHTQAVAKLMKDCGVATQTKFSDKTHGSSSSLWNVAEALTTYFYYDSSTQHYSRSDFDKDGWMNIIYRELDNGRPVIYAGKESDNSNSNGHAFVLHGYDSEGNVYINWGWDGRCDGYFDIDLLNPDQHSYNYRQEMVVAIPRSSIDYNFYTMDISAIGSGSVCFGSSSGIQIRDNSQSFRIKEGNNVTLVITPDAGCRIKSVLVNGNDMTSNVSDNTYTISNVYSDMTIVIEFEDSSDIFNSEYNLYVSCMNTSQSKTIIGSNVTNKVGLEISNSGNEAINITKLIARDPETNTVILTSTDTSILGVIAGNNKKNLTLTLSKDVLPIYEMEYTVGNQNCFYVSSKYRILTITANNYGYIKFADVSVGSNPNKFSIIPNEKAIIEVVPKVGCELSKLMVNSSDVTSMITNNQYVVENIISNMVVKATFDVVSGDQPTIDGHEYVDLGLPSGKYWSTKNYGANLPEEAGTYYSSASSKAWGEKWKTPTKEEFQELIDECEWTWTELNGMNGYSVKGSNGNTMFLPAAGKKDRIWGSSNVGGNAYYFTSSEDNYGIYNWLFSGSSSEYKLISSHIIMEEYPIRPISTVMKEPTFYNLSIKVKGNGSVIYDDRIIRENKSTFEIKEGLEVTIKIEPDESNIIKVFKENGNDVLSQLSNNQYVINKLSQNTEIEVEFEYVAPSVYSLIYIVDGNVYKTYEIEEGTTITPEREPTKEGYTFSGWSEIPQIMPDHDVTVTGTFTINKYLLTYIVDGEEYKSYELEFGATITPEPAPTKEGCAFSGWSEIPQTMPARNVTITGSFTANTYRLIYIVDGVDYKSYNIGYGVTITPEPAPSKEGYTFSGWSDIPATMPDHDVIVTGIFTINKYLLTYIVDGEEYKSYELEYGAAITPEPAPSKEGYTFSGWSDIPQTMPARNVTVTGTFAANTFWLTYIVDGIEYKSFEIEYGTTITPEPTPTKEGYTFSGWSYIPSKMPAENVTVTGTFTINKYKLIYMVDGKEYKSYEIEYGTTITPEPTPTKEGYTFSGWSYIPSKMPAENVTVTGTFTINKYKLTYMIDDKVYKEVEYEFGATIVPEQQPDDEDYVSFEWVGLPETMPAHDVTVYANYDTGIHDILMSQKVVHIYNSNGIVIDQPQKGLNIIQMSDGTTRKVLIK